MPIVEVQSAAFLNTVLMSTSDLIIVDFYAPWCGPCRVLCSYLEEFSRTDTRIRIVKVTVDVLPDLAATYQVSRLPTIVFYKSGHMVDSIVGFDKAKIAAAIMKYA